MSTEAGPSVPTSKGQNPHIKLSLSTVKAGLELPHRPQHDDEDTEPDEPVEIVANPDEAMKRIAAARQRHQADLQQYHYEPPKADRVQNDWQVAYVWAFIVKFDQRDRIRKLECLDDFERSILEPVANRPDDVLEGVLIRFLSNLKPGLRNLDCTNIQSHLSNFISDMLLHSTDFTVWDRPWAPNEEARAGCCNKSADRHELGRLRYVGEPLVERARKNPIKRIEERGGGLFELDWRERAKLLRQLVDWQLTLSDPIRSVINRVNRVSDPKSRKAVQEVIESDILTEPLGQDRDKFRIWSFDDSGRLYKSGNPFKRPCPLIVISTSRPEMQALLDKVSAFGSQIAPKLKGSGAKGKPTAAETRAYRTLSKGIEDEKCLAERLEELVPAYDKEEARIQRARRKIAAAAELAQMAESRVTRTRRPTKRIDYTYDDDSEIDEVPPKRARHETNGSDEVPATVRGKPFIPGERKSARTARADAVEIKSVNGDASSSTSGQANGEATATACTPNGTVVARPKGKMKGYAYVPDDRPFGQLTPKEQKQQLMQRQTGLDEARPSTNGHHNDAGALGSNSGRADRAENGYVTDDSLSSVSPDGEAWEEAMKADEIGA